MGRYVARTGKINTQFEEEDLNFKTPPGRHDLRSKITDKMDLTEM